MQDVSDSILKTNLAGLELISPVLLAAGTAGTIDELAEVIDLSGARGGRVGGVGAVVGKSITAEPREGNGVPRIVGCRGAGVGMLNAIGLANVGIDYWMEHLSLGIAECPTPIIGSIAGHRIDDYVRVASQMDEVDALAGVEINVSCPNVQGGTEFGSDPKALAELVCALRPVLSRKIMIVKLSPIAVGMPDIVDIARAAIAPGNQTAGPNQRPGADALTLTNTMPAMQIDVKTRKPVLANAMGGLSGPAIHPVVVRLIHRVYREIARDSSTPIIGVGGVMSWKDAAEFVLAGASAVGIGTGLFVDPRIPNRVSKGLGRWVTRQGAQQISELVGAVKLD